MALKTWEETKSFDEILTKGEIDIINAVERESADRCPNLKKDGNYFYYCGLNLIDEQKENIESAEIGPFHPVYLRHNDTAFLQLYCMSDFEKCCYFSGKLKR